jgi:recombination protein RecT
MSTETVKGKLVAVQQGGAASRTVYDLLERQKSQIALALPRAMSADRFARIVFTECRRTPRLLGCTPESLLGAVMLGAQLGLEPGPLGHCYLVPFRNSKARTVEVQFIIGYRGLIDLARRSGNIESIVARDVRQGDWFEFEYGLDERLVHRPPLTDRGDPVAYYGIARYRDGGHSMLVMSLADIAMRRLRSRSKDAGPWVTDFDAMARKTVIRAMAAYLPLSIEAASAVAADESVVTELGPDVLENAALPGGDDDLEGDDLEAVEAPAGEVAATTENATPARPDEAAPKAPRSRKATPPAE